MYDCVGSVLVVVPRERKYVQTRRERNILITISVVSINSA